jgi:hypothetical protein
MRLHWGRVAIYTALWVAFWALVAPLSWDTDPLKGLAVTLVVVALGAVPKLVKS